MANESHNPLSKLLDIDFPEVKKANWNVSYDLQTTSDVGYAKPVHTDHILAGSHVKMDINQASFANPTKAPLYGRYRVKYLAFWSPDRLYIPPWRDGDVMVNDDYPYPVVPSFVRWRAADNFQEETHDSAPIVEPTSLLSYLGMFPANYDPSIWKGDDYPEPKNALPLLTFWDIYRHYILNPQEDKFPIRVNGFIPQHTDDGSIVEASNPSNVYPTRLALDQFFKDVRRNYENNIYDITTPYQVNLGHDIFSRKLVAYSDSHQGYQPSQISNAVHLPNYHYGLPIAPYGADMFTSWVSNENVELERNSSKMDVSNGILTMDQWVLASRIQNKVRKSIFKNSDFAQYIDVQYGIKPPTTLTKPMFLGAFVSDIVFNDVISSAQLGDPNSEADIKLNNNKNLGSRAGYGRGTDYDKHNFIEFTAEEPGTLMVLQIVTPEVFYYEGYDEFYDVTNFNEEFNPAFDGVGFTPLQKAVMNSVPQLFLDPLNRQAYNQLPFSSYNTSIGQQPYGMMHMAKVNKLSGQMAEFGVYQSYALARSFNYVRTLYESSISSNPNMYSSYIIPEMFNNSFTSFVQDNFQFYLSFDYLKYQPISKQFLSFHN